MRTPISALLYVNQKRFAEAIPELEKAVDIQPKNPLLEISLGQAYIAHQSDRQGNGRLEKAISSGARSADLEQHRLLALRAERAARSRRSNMQTPPSMRWKRNCAT